MDERDTTSEMTKKLRKLAVECVRKLREASDDGVVCTPRLVGEVQNDVFLKLSQVYYCCCDELDADVAGEVE
jgi:hypothetical protein